jgi:hypothetical protein
LSFHVKPEAPPSGRKRQDVDLTAYNMPTTPPKIALFIISGQTNGVNHFLKGLKKFLSLGEFDLTIPQQGAIIFLASPPVAQLDSVADSDSEGRGFESLRAGQKETSFVYQDKRGFSCFPG